MGDGAMPPSTTRAFLTGVADVWPVSAESHSTQAATPKTGKIKGPAPAQLLIRRAPALGRRQLNVDEQFVNHVFSSNRCIVVVEVAGFNNPFTRVEVKRNFAPTATITAPDRMIARPSISTPEPPSKYRRLLQTEINAFAPFVVLIVVVAAGIQ